MQLQVVVATADPELGGWSQAALTNAGVHTTLVANAFLLPGELRRLEPDALLLDAVQPGLPIAALMESLRRNDCLRRTTVVLYVARDDAAAHVEAAGLGAVCAVAKTASADELVARLRQVTSPALPTTSVLFKKETVVMVQEPTLERRVVVALQQLGLSVTTRGVAALSWVLQEEGSKILVLDPAAFDKPLDASLQRYAERGYLSRAAVLTLGPSAVADGQLTAEDLADPGGRLKLALKGALRASRARRRKAKP